MSILNILEEGDHRAANAKALHAPGRNPITYSALRAHVVRTAAGLRQRGLRRDDIIAIVLPNGPEMASASLSASAAGVCAPLHPAYQAEEVEFYLSALAARALLVAGLPASPPREVGRRHGSELTA